MRMRINLSSILKESLNENDIKMVLTMKKGSPKEISINSYRNMCIVAHDDNAQSIGKVNNLRKLDNEFEKIIGSFGIYPPDIKTVHVTIPALSLEYSFGAKPKPVVFYPFNDTKARFGTLQGNNYVEPNGKKWEKKDCKVGEFFTCLADVDKRLNCTGDLVLRHQNNVLFVENRDKGWYHKDTVAVFSGDLNRLSTFLANFGFGEWWYVHGTKISNRVYEIDYEVPLMDMCDGVSPQENVSEKIETDIAKDVKTGTVTSGGQLSKSDYCTSLENRLAELSKPTKEAVREVAEDSLTAIRERNKFTCGTYNLPMPYSYALKNMIDRNEKEKELEEQKVAVKKEVFELARGITDKIVKGVAGFDTVNTFDSVKEYTEKIDTLAQKNSGAFPVETNKAFLSSAWAIRNENENIKSVTELCLEIEAIKTLLGINLKERSATESLIKQLNDSRYEAEQFVEIEKRKETLAKLQAESLKLKTELERCKVDLFDLTGKY